MHRPDVKWTGWNSLRVSPLISISPKIFYYCPSQHPLISLKGWQHNTAITTRCAVRREERIPTSNLQHLAKNDSKSAHVWTRQNVVVSTRYNVASVAAGNLTTKKYTLRGYFHHYYYYFNFFRRHSDPGLFPKDPGL